MVIRYKITDFFMIMRYTNNKVTTNKHFNQIFERKKIPVEWKEAKMIILNKKGDTRNIKITGRSVYFPTYTNCSHGYYKKNGKGSG